jgi:hypothetical protein
MLYNDGPYRRTGVPQRVHSRLQIWSTNEDGINESWLELHSESALLVVFATPTLGS